MSRIRALTGASPTSSRVELGQHLVDLRLAEQRGEVDRAGQGGEVGHGTGPDQ